MTAGNDLPVALACHHERLLYFVTRLSAGDCAKDRNGSIPETRDAGERLPFRIIPLRPG